MTAHKYQDADVRSKPSLMAMAVTYAQQYRGNFEFMQAASAAANATGTLPVGVARGVLNCMRADPEVADQMPEAMAPDPLSWKDPFSYGASLKGVTDPQPRRLKVVPPPKYVPVNMRLKFTYFWNASYVPDFKNVFHIVSMATKAQLESGAIKIYMSPICRFNHVNTAFIKVGNNPPSTYELCGSCNIQLEKGERHHAKRKAFELE